MKRRFARHLTLRFAGLYIPLKIRKFAVLFEFCPTCDWGS